MKEPIDPQKVIRAVCTVHNVTEEQLKAKTRKREVVNARHQAIYFLHTLSNLGKTEAGLVVLRGRADANHAIKNVAQFISIEPMYRDLYFSVYNALGCGN